jgi:nucleoid-associated protein YgaU
MKLILMSLLLTGLISCSAKKQDSMQDDSAIELTDSDELLESSDDLALTDETLSEEPMADGNFNEDSDMMVNEEVAMDEPVEMEEPVAMQDTSTEEIVIDQVGSQMQYTVEKGDTLMMIAFKIYGDYSKWREIANLNQNKLIQGQIAPIGTSLTYYAPSEAFSWNPEGNPYLVKNGDTLGGISTDTYGTMKFWKNIWDNNKPLIKNPNRIYAGFTIYTPIMEGREVATE